jgi:hypothetical protein
LWVDNVAVKPRYHGFASAPSGREIMMGAGPVVLDFRPGCQPGRDRPAAPIHQREIVEIVLHLSRRAVCTKHSGGRPYAAGHWPEVRLGVRREKAAFPVGAGPFAPGGAQAQVQSVSAYCASSNADTPWMAID